MRKWCAVSVDGRNIASDQEGPFVAARVTFRFLRPLPPSMQCCFALLRVSLHARNIASQHCIEGGRGARQKHKCSLARGHASRGSCLSCNISSFHCTGDCACWFKPKQTLKIWILYGSHSKHGPIGRRPVGRRPSGPLTIKLPGVFFHRRDVFAIRNKYEKIVRCFALEIDFVWLSQQTWPYRSPPHMAAA